MAGMDGSMKTADNSWIVWHSFTGKWRRFMRKEQIGKGV